MAKIRTYLARLGKEGTRVLIGARCAEKMNDVWQLRAGAHRIFYFWHTEARQYVILNGFRKSSRKTPRQELARAETLRAEHLGG